MLKTPLQSKAHKLLQTNGFNLVVLVAIVLNGLLIGWQTYDDCPFYVRYIQLTLLFIFFVEIIIRWLGRNSTQQYLSDPWNYFDVFILLAGVVPELVEIMTPQAEDNQSSILATLRVLRVIQLSRSIRAVEELRLLVFVLLRSIRSLSYIAVLFLLVMYVYAVIGVTLFKNRDYKNSEHLQLTVSNPDPWGDVGEGFFTLFRVMTGEDWTDLRYNLLDNEYTQKDDGQRTRPNASNFTVTFFYVSWMVTAAYLLMNLVVGAIVTNFQLVLEAKKAEAKNKDDTATDNPTSSA